MLWMKYWMETRWRLLSAVGVFVLLVFVLRSQQLGAQPSTRGVVGFFAFVYVMQAVTLAGTGIKTQAPFQMGKGLHGSMHFTLSLPVSRLHLLATRATVGLLELLCALVLG